MTCVNSLKWVGIYHAMRNRSMKRNTWIIFFLPVIFHNQKNYDSHFIVKHFEKRYVEHRNTSKKVSYDDVKVIPLNSEKYMMFEIGYIRFLDSYQFLSTSLENLVSLLLKSGRDKFANTTKYLSDHCKRSVSLFLHDITRIICRNTATTNRDIL